MTTNSSPNEKLTAKENIGVDDLQLVVFKIADEEFGVNINEVKEIIRWTDVTRIPNSEAYIKGVINLRGSIVVVNDLAMKLGLPSKKVDDETRILVVEVGNDNTVGMVVDSATEVLHLDSDKVKPAPDMIKDEIGHNYIDGVGVLDEQRLLTLLNLGKVLKSDDFKNINKAQEIGQQHIQNSSLEEHREDQKQKQDESVDNNSTDNSKKKNEHQGKQKDLQKSKKTDQKTENTQSKKSDKTESKRKNAKK